jgi:hypothetical protein
LKNIRHFFQGSQCTPFANQFVAYHTFLIYNLLFLLVY